MAPRRSAWCGWRLITRTASPSDQNNLDTPSNGHGPSITALDQVISAILGTREDAAQSSYQMTSTAVTCADPTEAAAAARETGGPQGHNPSFWGYKRLAITLACSFRSLIGRTRSLCRDLRLRV
jgi:hypothetical protein